MQMSTSRFLSNVTTVAPHSKRLSDDFLHIMIALTIEDFHVFICHMNLLFPLFFFDEFSLCLWLFYYSNVHIFLIELCRKCRTIILWKMRCLRNNQWNNFLALLLGLLYKSLAFSSSLWSSPNNICFVLPDSNWYLLTWMPKHLKCLILSFNILN